MLKFLLGFLLVANLALLAFNSGALGTASVEGREPNRSANQLNAQRIVLVEPGRAVGGAVAGTVAGTTPPDLPAPASTGTPVALAGTEAAVAAVTAASASTTAATTAATPASIDPATQCVEIGNFDAADATRFAGLVAPLASPERVTRRSVQEVERYIVYIPPLADKESADRKAAELRRLGIEDFFIFNDNSDLRNGISLGLFKTADGASQHLATLTRKGVRSAKVAARVGANSKTAFQLRGLDAAGQAALTRIQASFPRQETRSCAAS